MKDPSIVSPEDRTVIRGEDEEGTPPRQPKRPPYVVVLEGPHAGTYFALKDEKSAIGRATECAVRLDDQSVSRHHAELTRTETGWMIRDLGSKNGTFVNGSVVTDYVVIGHKDIIKTGIYLLRLVTQPVSVEEEMALPPEIAAAERTLISEMPSAPEALTSEMGKGEEIPPVPEPVEEIEEKPPSKMRSYFMVGFLFICVIGAVAYFASRYFLHPKAEQVATEAAAPEAQPPPEGAMPAYPPTAPLAGPPPEGTMPGVPSTPSTPPVPQKVPVFLDFVSSPLPATVNFQGKELGKTPLRVNVELEAGKTYTAEGVFFMPEVQERYPLPVNFSVEVGQSVIPILFRGPIGMIKVNNLPRDVQFYLEGSYEYDRFKQRPAKLNEVVMQKPIYIPFGHYLVELRRARQLGESQTFVQDIVFRREFTIAEDSPSYMLDVKDDDLKIFPVDIKSDPPNADVFIDGKLMGKTPFQGLFPLGDHTLTLRKEGYFENSQALKVDINTPFVATIKLETSIAGAHINNAKVAINRELYPEAINELAQALASNPAPTEIAEANYLLGRSYLSLGDIERALIYFEQSKTSEDWKYPSMLGMVAAYAAAQRMDAALPLLVEVLLKSKDENVKRDANALFQQISPFRSVIYVYTDPEGARIIVNDKPVEQPTPAILHDLPLGSYRLRLEKPGYQPVELKLTLSINEFNPVIVKFKPVVQ